MIHRPTPRTMAALATLLTLAGAGCDSKSSDEGGVTAAEMKLVLEGTFGNIPNLQDALDRLVTTLQGTPQPGVTLTPITDGVQGSVTVDPDGDGTAQVTVNGTLVYIDPQQGIDGGAVLTIASITGGGTTGTLTVAAVPTSPTDVAFSPGSGSFQTSSSNDITVPVINFTLDASGATPVLDGFVTFGVDGNPGSMFFEDDGLGGFQLRVVFLDEEFIVP